MSNQNVYTSPSVSRQTARKIHVLPAEAAISTALMSLLAIPILFGLNYSQSMEEEVILASVAVVVCAAIFYFSYKLVFSRLAETTRSDWYLAWFSLFAFTSIVDLLLAFNIHGDIHVMDWCV